MGGCRASLNTATVAVVSLVMFAAATVLSLAAAASSGNFSKEVAALMAVKAALQDPGHVLRDWDAAESGDNPCRWSMIYCHHGQVHELNLKHKNLSGELSPVIGKLTSLRFLYLSQNAISGPIPDTVGRMHLLQKLDLSNNQFNGSIPSALGGLLKLQYLELNNNSLSGPIPQSLATARNIFNLDLSFNNLSGPRPMFRASIVSLEGNPFLSGINCGKGEPGVGNPLSGGNCSNVIGEEDDLPPLIQSPTEKPADNSQDTDDENKYIPYLIVLCIATVCMVAATFSAGAALFLCRGHQPPQVFSVVDVADDPSAISITESGLSQYSLSSSFTLP